MRNETINTKVDAEEVKKAIVDNMEKALNEYDWRYTRKALEKIYDKFMERKGSLIDILSKHPKWNAEKLYIHFDANYTRTFDKEELESFVNYFRHNIFEIENVSPTEKLRESFPIFYQKVENLYWTSLGKMSYFFDILTEYIEGSRVTKKIEETINDQYPELKCKEGQKLARLLNKYCVMVGFDKEPDYNRRFAKLADSLNPITYTRHTVLSVNPVDYLMMSNGNTWASCHTIDVEVKIMVAAIVQEHFRTCWIVVRWYSTQLMKVQMETTLNLNIKFCAICFITSIISCCKQDYIHNATITSAQMS